MKAINLIVLLFCITATAQIKGNKKIETKTFTINQIETIKVNLYADVIIDVSKPQSLTITTDNNLFDLIEKDITNKTLLLDQKEWIQPSEKVKIVIGAPSLKAVEQGTHDFTKIINVNNDQLRLMALVGTVIVSGQTKNLNIGIEVGTVDATNLIAQNANVNIWSWGTAKVNVIEELNSKLDKNANLIIVNNPKILKGDTQKTLKKVNLMTNKDVRYIKFKLKNNSLSRNHFFVVGPKPDGSSFGYGFPMMPQALRKENWTVGTKVYKVNALGFRKLLITITEENEEQVVNLFR